jgi:hypothetical protein
MSNILAWLKQPQIILVAVIRAKLNDMLSADQNFLHHIKKYEKKNTCYGYMSRYREHLGIIIN